MPRERDRYTPTLWLSRLGPEDLDGTWAYTASGVLPPISLTVAALNSYGYTVVMEMVEDQYRVRLMPRRGKTAYENHAAHISYAGRDLAQVLATALVEVQMIATEGFRVQVSTRQHTRRVR